MTGPKSTRSFMRHQNNSKVRSMQLYRILTTWTHSQTICGIWTILV